MMKYMIFPITSLAAGIFLSYIGQRESVAGLFTAFVFLSAIAMVCIYHDKGDRP